MFFRQNHVFFSKYGGTVIRGRSTSVSTEVNLIMFVIIARITVISIKNTVFDAKICII